MSFFFFLDWISMLLKLALIVSLESHALFFVLLFILYLNLVLLDFINNLLLGIFLILKVFRSSQMELFGYRSSPSVPFLDSSFALIAAQAGLMLTLLDRVDDER